MSRLKPINTIGQVFSPMLSVLQNARGSCRKSLDTAITVAGPILFRLESSHIDFHHMDTPSHARCHECVCSVRVRMPLYTPHAPSEGCGCQTCRPGHVARVPQPEAAIIASCRDAVFTIWVGLNAAHAATVLLVGKYTIRHSAVETRPRRSVHVSNIPALWNNEKVCACVRACVFVCVCVSGKCSVKKSTSNYEHVYRARVQDTILPCSITTKNPIVFKLWEQIK